MSDPISPAAEFPDWLSPILVKELRQGMRTKVFVGSFMLLQVAMVLLALFALGAAAHGNPTDDFSGVFWVLVGVPLVIVLPSAALGAIGAERKANTLEMIFLTRLTARRILFGKWFAVVLQSVLLVSAVVPYAVLRYFLGGVNLAVELQVLAALLVSSCVFAGCAVGISPMAMRVTRGLLGSGVFVLLFGLQALSQMGRFMFGMGYRSSSFGLSSAAGIWVSTLLFSAALIFLFLEYGSGLIAPPAENHSTSQRLLALGCLAFGALAILLVKPMGLTAAAVAVLLALVICLGVLMETPRPIPRLYQPFVRLGPLGRALGRLLYPGWPSGVFFTLLVFAISYGLGRLGLLKMPKEALIVVWVSLGVLLAPVAAVRLFAPRTARPLAGFILAQCFTVLLFAIAGVIKAVTGDESLHFVFTAWPSYAVVSVPLEVTQRRMDLETGFLPAALFTGISLLVLFYRMRTPWREIRACEKQAATLSPHSTAPVVPVPTLP